MKQGTAAERQAAVPTTMNSGVSHLTDFFTVLNRALSQRLLCGMYQARMLQAGTQKSDFA